MAESHNGPEYNEFQSFIGNSFINVEEIKKSLDKWKKAKINIAIIGEIKVGKSTLINP